MYLFLSSNIHHRFSRESETAMFLNAIDAILGNKVSVATMIDDVSICIDMRCIKHSDTFTYWISTTFNPLSAESKINTGATPLSRNVKNYKFRFYHVPKQSRKRPNDAVNGNFNIITSWIISPKYYHASLNWWMNVYTMFVKILQWSTLSRKEISINSKDGK